MNWSLILSVFNIQIGSNNFGLRSQSNRKTIRLPYDVLLSIFENLDDYKTLHSCSLVSWEASSAAARSLYRSVVFEPSNCYGYQDTEIKEEDTPVLQSACLPKYAHHVRRFEVRGFLSLRSGTRNRIILAEIIERALRSFSNLRSATFVPISYYSELFSGALRALSEHSCPYLVELRLDESAINKENITALRKIGGLRKLVIEYATPAVVTALNQEWLDQSKSSLTELHFEGVCLPITSEILTSQLPNLQNIQVFELGLIDYSGDGTVLYRFLEGLPLLHTLSLYYSDEHHALDGTSCHIPQLESLTVRYFGPQSQSDTDTLCKWVYGMIERSPLLARLCLFDDNGESIHNFTNATSVASFDLLIERLVNERASHLRNFQIPNGFLGSTALASVCLKCPHLEEFSVATSKVALFDFVRSLRNAHRCSLRLAVFNLRQSDEESDESVAFSLAEASEVIEYLPNLQTLVVNKNKWETQRVKLDRGDFVRIVKPKKLNVASQ